MENFLKPIGRRTYILGIVAIFIMDVIVASFFVGPGLRNGNPDAKGNALILIILTTIVLTIWDYKRMRDIFIEKKSQIFIWLVLIVLHILFFITSPAIEPLISKSQVGFFDLIFFAFDLFLIFKKGHPDSARNTHNSAFY